MSRSRIFFFVFAMCMSTAMLLAQGNPYSDDARQSYRFIKGNLLNAADKMPTEATHSGQRQRCEPLAR
jgi:hypothetical protein